VNNDERNLAQRHRHGRANGFESTPMQRNDKMWIWGTYVGLTAFWLRIVCLFRGHVRYSFFGPVTGITWHCRRCKRMVP
jgi:hypothetical protein